MRSTNGAGAIAEPTQWKERLAAHIVGELPDDEDDALEVLRIARRLMDMMRLVRRG